MSGIVMIPTTFEECCADCGFGAHSIVPMSSVFLSYARANAAKARQVAESLDSAGHSVWWDERLPGGSRFAGAIEEALERADVVVVLWSKSSIKSAWVCDEAAEGRDHDLLIPVLIEKCRPPIGFRQFQCVDLSGGGEKRNGDGLRQLSAAIAEKCGEKVAAVASPASKGRSRSGTGARIWMIAAALAALIASSIAVLFWTRTQAYASEPVVAVLPFDDLSPKRDQSYLADGIAEEVLMVISRQPGMNVIGRTSAAQFRDSPNELEQMHKALGVTHVLEGSAETAGDRLRMRVRLIEVASGRQIWSQDYRRQMTDIFALQDDIGQSVARQLKGAIAGRGSRFPRDRTNVDSYTLYLAARAKLHERRRESIEEALALAKQLVGTDPNYGPGHALYADAITLLADTSYGQIPARDALGMAVPEAKRAIELAPNSADGYAALGAAWAQTDGARAVAPLQKAIELDPSRADIRLWLGTALGDMGRNHEALVNVRRALDVDPLLRSAVWRLVVIHAASGQYDQAEAVVNDYSRRGGSGDWVNFNRGVIDQYRGDYASSVQKFRAALRGLPGDRVVRLALARSYYQLGLFEAADALSSNEKPLIHLYFMNAPGAQRLLTAHVRAFGSVTILTSPWKFLAARKTGAG